MKGPKCRLCGKEHFSNEPHRFDDEKGNVEKGGGGYSAPIAAKPAKSSASAAGQVAANRRWREKNPERYKKYQREYMRERRKK